MSLERNEPESFVQNFGIFHHMSSHRHFILKSFVLIFLQKVSKGFNCLKPQQALQNNQCFRGPLHCCFIAVLFHTLLGKKANKFVITAYEYPHYILLTNYPTGRTSLQTFQIRTKIFNSYLGKGVIELCPHKLLQKF